MHAVMAEGGRSPAAAVGSALGAVAGELSVGVVRVVDVVG